VGIESVESESEPFALENQALAPAFFIGLIWSYQFENEERAVDDGKGFGGRGMIDESTEGAGEGQLFIKQAKGLGPARWGARDGYWNEARRCDSIAGNRRTMGIERQAGVGDGGMG